jgi:hypothetical protein
MVNSLLVIWVQKPKSMSAKLGATDHFLVFNNTIAVLSLSLCNLNTYLVVILSLRPIAEPSANITKSTMPTFYHQTTSGKNNS